MRGRLRRPARLSNTSSRWRIRRPKLGRSICPRRRLNQGALVEIRYRASEWKAPKGISRTTSHAFPHLLVARMRIHRCRQRAHVSRKPLRQEQFPACPVDVGDRRVPERMEWLGPIKSGIDLPGPEGELDAALADTDVGLGAE
jgi:hypothetical protein